MIIKNCDLAITNGRHDVEWHRVNTMPYNFGIRCNWEELTEIVRPSQKLERKKAKRNLCLENCENIKKEWIFEDTISLKKDIKLKIIIIKRYLTKTFAVFLMLKFSQTCGYIF